MLQAPLPFGVISSQENGKIAVRACTIPSPAWAFTQRWSIIHLQELPNPIQNHLSLIPPYISFTLLNFNIGVIPFLSDVHKTLRNVDMSSPTMLTFCFWIWQPSFFVIVCFSESSLNSVFNLIIFFILSSFPFNFISSLRALLGFLLVLQLTNTRFFDLSHPLCTSSSRRALDLAVPPYFFAKTCLSLQKKNLLTEFSNTQNHTGCFDHTRIHSPNSIPI